MFREVFSNYVYHLPASYLTHPWSPFHIPIVHARGDWMRLKVSKSGHQEVKTGCEDEEETAGVPVVPSTWVTPFSLLKEFFQTDGWILWLETLVVCSVLERNSRDSQSGGPDSEEDSSPLHTAQTRNGPLEATDLLQIHRPKMTVTPSHSPQKTIVESMSGLVTLSK